MRQRRSTSRISQPESDLASPTGQISDAALVMAVDVASLDVTSRTAGNRSGSLHQDGEVRISLSHSFDHESIRQREKW